MQCPYCDSIIKVVPDSGTCPRCGGTLGEVIRKRVLFPEPPIGMYKCYYGYMSIGTEAVTFYKNVPPNPPTCRRIPFDQIDRVVFLRAPGLFRDGYLCVREKKDREIPMIDGFFSAAKDQTSIEVGLHVNELANRIYLFFKQCADISKII